MSRQMGRSNRPATAAAISPSSSQSHHNQTTQQNTRPVAPTLRAPQGPLVVRVDDELTLFANVDGYPPPVVTWHIGPLEIHTLPGQYDVTTTGNCHALRIISAKEELNNTGVFVVAANQYGIEKRHFNISVYKVFSGRPRQRASSKKLREVQRSPDNVDRKPPAKSFQLVPFRDHSAGNSIGSSPQLAYRQGSELGIGRLRSQERLPHQRIQSADRIGTGKTVSFSVADVHLSAAEGSSTNCRSLDVSKSATVPRTYQSADCLLSSSRWLQKRGDVVASNNSLNGSSEASSQSLDRHFSSTEGLLLETSQSHATPLIVHDLSAGELNITRGVNKQCVKKGNTLSSSAKELSSAKISLPPSAYVDDWAIKLSSRSDCWNLTESIKLSDFCRSSLEELCATEMESKVQKGGDNFVKAKKKDSSKKKLKSKSSHDSLDFKNKTCSSANNSFAAQENLLNIEQEILKSCSEIISDLDARTAEIASLVSQNNDEGNTSFSSYSSVRDCENVSIKQRMSRKDRPRKSKQVKSDTNNVDPTTLVFDSNKSEDNVYGDHARPYQMKGVSPPYPIEIIPLKDTSLIYKDPYSMNSILSDDENILNNEILLSSQKKKGSKSLKSMPEKKTTKKKKVPTATLR